LTTFFSQFFSFFYFFVAWLHIGYVIVLTCHQIFQLLSAVIPLRKPTFCLAFLPKCPTTCQVPTSRCSCTFLSLSRWCQIQCVYRLSDIESFPNSATSILLRITCDPASPMIFQAVQDDGCQLLLGCD
jgi:hypothetical protein